MRSKIHKVFYIANMMGYKITWVKAVEIAVRFTDRKLDKVLRRVLSRRGLI